MKVKMYVEIRNNTSDAAAEEQGEMGKADCER